jgi:hypothetical protein
MRPNGVSQDDRSTDPVRGPDAKPLSPDEARAIASRFFEVRERFRGKPVAPVTSLQDPVERIESALKLLAGRPGKFRVRFGRDGMEAGLLDLQAFIDPADARFVAEGADLTHDGAPVRRRYSTDEDISRWSQIHADVKEAKHRAARIVGVRELPTEAWADIGAGADLLASATVLERLPLPDVNPFLAVGVAAGVLAAGVRLLGGGDVLSAIAWAMVASGVAIPVGAVAFVLGLATSDSDIGNDMLAGILSFGVPAVVVGGIALLGPTLDPVAATLVIGFVLAALGLVVARRTRTRDSTT